MVCDTGFEPVTSTVGAQKEGKAENIRGNLTLIYNTELKQYHQTG